ncbi:hypothetical protein Q4489_06670 [Thalassotalea sp. 1_MG-2023]|uniref:hypothetical protein n=1 Tax=Thalassotalea sp. 1_MG-2023 TaxID=3062680 RepID=UPI0026E32385|nr:hypothetical protein [Thalassotalea sp. 1_MG-2023]MDO6426689.1 hypothetical protein [Thalassotalea sp. 1_MG-2023]
MLNINEWLLISSVLVFSIQGTAIEPRRIKFLLPIVMCILLFITIAMTDFITAQRLPHWLSIAKQQSQALQIIVLLEAALVCFSQLKVLPISFLLAFSLGHLTFLQQGFVEGTFIMQGIMYAVIVTVLIFINCVFAAIDRIWRNILFTALLLSVFFTSFEMAENVDVAFSWFELFISVLSVIALLLLGVIQHKFNNIRN